MTDYITKPFDLGEVGLTLWGYCAGRQRQEDYSKLKSRSKASTGLGLSIVKLLTEQMGGTVGASLIGNYIAIRVELPLYH